MAASRTWPEPIALLDRELRITRRRRRAHAEPPTLEKLQALRLTKGLEEQLQMTGIEAGAAGGPRDDGARAASGVPPPAIPQDISCQPSLVYLTSGSR